MRVGWQTVGRSGWRQSDWPGGLHKPTWRYNLWGCCCFGTIFACCVALIYNISCVCECECTLKWGEKENCKKTEAAYEMLQRPATSHRAPHLAWSVAHECGAAAAAADHESRWPATGSNSPLNALEPSFVPKKNLNFKFCELLWLLLHIVVVVDSGFASSCSTCPAGLTSKLDRQPVDRSLALLVCGK